MCSDVPNALSFADAIPLCLVGNAACSCGGEAADTHRRRACHPAAAGGVLLPDRLLPVWPTSSRGRWPDPGRHRLQLERRPPCRAGGRGAGGTTPLAAGLAARRVQADLAVLVEAKANGTELKITGTPVLPESGRGKVPPPFTQQGTRTSKRISSASRPGLSRPA